MLIKKVNNVVAAANEFGSVPHDYINPKKVNNTCTREKAIELAKMLNDNGIVQGWAVSQQYPCFEYEFAIWELNNPNHPEKEANRMYILGATLGHTVDDLSTLLTLNVTGN